MEKTKAPAPPQQAPPAGAPGVWHYAPAPEARDHVKIADRADLFIGGQFVAPRSQRRFAMINPATEERLADVAEAGPEDVDAAVRAARKAFRGWSRLSGAERAKYLFRVARMIQERSRELAVLETLNGGKPIRESRDVDVPLAAAHFFHHAGWADKLDYVFPGRRPRPLGVAGQVIPWNFPLLMAAWKIAPALAAGNTVVLKPAETTPLTALRLAEVLRDAGLFGPVLSILTFRTPEEAIEKANNTCYGLSAGVWTDKGAKILQLATRLRAGVIWTNTFNKFDPCAPFGGYQESGFGREGGRQGLLAYLELDA